MHMPKSLLVVGVSVLCLTTFSVQAKDTAEDAKLRDAMRNKISETSPQPATPATTVTPAPATPAKSAAPAAPAKPAPTATTAAPATPPPAAPAAVAAPTATATDSETDALRQAMHDRMAQSKTAEPVATNVKPPTKTQASNYAPLTPPASPLTATKEQRLQALLDQYKADQITPEEYHKQRAKIIAE